MARTETSAEHGARPAPVSRCANCETVLAGPFCARCGQEKLDLHRPFRHLLAEVVGEIFSFDTRFVRTLRPLLFQPGAVPAGYLAGRRATYVTPVRSYLIAALILFGPLALLPTNDDIEVFTQGETIPASTGGSRLTVELPPSMPIGNDWYQRTSARAKANPEAFNRAINAGVPRLFFFFVPIFALLLEFFYRREGYYLDHLIFALYYHAFVFLSLAALLFVRLTLSWVPGLLTMVVNSVVIAWLMAYLPLSLKRVYGGTWPKTFLKLSGLGTLYLAVFTFVGFPLVTFIAFVTF